MHDEWLQNAALSDVRGEFFERVLGELGARVVRVLMDQRDSHKHRPAVCYSGLGISGWDRQQDGRRSVRVRGRAGEPLDSVRLWLEGEQIELSAL